MNVYGGWVDKAGSFTEVGYQDHFNEAQKILGKKTTRKYGVYNIMFRLGYLRVYYEPCNCGSNWNDEDGWDEDDDGFEYGNEVECGCDPETTVCYDSRYVSAINRRTWIKNAGYAYDEPRQREYWPTKKDYLEDKNR
jgi:hypothetical protein